jgi:two-component system NarL family sensor kinase
MPNKFPEIYILIVVGSVVALFLVSFAFIMVILYKRKQHTHEQELLKTQLEIQEETFKNISQEIHDNIGQVLSVVKLTLASAPLKKDDPAYEYLQDSKQMIGSVIDDVSNLSKSLHPDRIIKIGISDAIKFELVKLRKTGQFTTTFEPPEREVNLSSKNEILLFRVVQENLNNIVKHSGAKNIAVTMQHTAQAIHIEIKDDGKGFDVEKTLLKTSMEKGIGLSSMVNRTKMIGGTLAINSQPGSGTTVVIDLPAELSSNDNKKTYLDDAQ